MCVQCMASAMAAVAGATGTRSWLASRRFRWLTPRRMRRVTAALMAAALLAASVLVSGSASSQPHQAAQGAGLAGAARH